MEAGKRGGIVNVYVKLSFKFSSVYTAVHFGVYCAETSHPSKMGSPTSILLGLHPQNQTLLVQNFRLNQKRRVTVLVSGSWCPIPW
jgi:hypothetical protein